MRSYVGRSRLQSALILSLGLLGISACGGDFHSITSKDKPSISEYSFNRSQTAFQESDQNLNASTKVTLENTDFGTPRRIERTQVNSPTSDLKIPTDQLQQLAEAAAKKLFPEYELRFLHIRQGAQFSYATFQQTFLGREVRGSSLILRLNKAGEWTTATTTLIDPRRLQDLSFNIPIDQKFSTSQVFPEPHLILKSQQVVYPRKDNEGSMQYHAAEEFVLRSLEHPREIMVWVDLQNLQALGVKETSEALADALEIKGSILPNAMGDEPLEVGLPNATIELENAEKVMADSEGRIALSKLGESKNLKVRLENPRVVVLNNNQADVSASFDLTKMENLSSLSMDQGPAMEVRNVYYWVMKARSFIENQLKYNGLDYQMVVVTNFGEEYDNAFFMPLSKTLSFGAGGKIFKNTAFSRDIVIHEFGHAVTHAIYGLVSGYEFSSMNEAMSDYLAATITNEPRIAEGMMLPAFHQEFLRSVDNKLVYPQDYLGDSFHNDGQLFSGALWELRKALGAELADQMIHEARLAHATSVREFLKELLAIDEATDDGNPLTLSKNARIIAKAFAVHGLNSRTFFFEKGDENRRLPWKSDAGCLTSSIKETK